MKQSEEYFKEDMFNESIIKARLPGAPLMAVNNTKSPASAPAAANAIKKRVIEKRAVHCTHWFRLMTGITFRKHGCFISPSQGGSAVMDFSGRKLPIPTCDELLLNVA